MAYTVKNLRLAYQTGTDNRTMFATWTWAPPTNPKWPANTTENYRVIWKYDTGDGVWFIGNDSTTENRQSTYSVPSNALTVRVYVTPIAKKQKITNSSKKTVESPYWTASAAYNQLLVVEDAEVINMPAPSTPRIAVSDHTLTMILDNISDELSPTHVRFEIIQDNSIKAVKTANVKISTRQAKYSYSIKPAKEYKVRARCYREINYALAGKKGKLITIASPWSDYSENVKAPEMSAPSAPSIDVSGQKLKVSLTVYNEPKATHVRFHIVRDNVYDVLVNGHTTVDVAIKKNYYAEYSVTVPAEHEYRVQARLLNKDKNGNIIQNSTYSEYSDNVTVEKTPPMEAPSTPSVEIKNLTLTASLSIYNDRNPTNVEFEVIQNNKTKFKTGKVGISTNYATFQCSVVAGNEYKVRARCYSSAQTGDWSEYSDNVATVPLNVSKFTSIKAVSETSVELKWDPLKNTNSYEIQYTDTKNYFDRAPGEVKSMSVDAIVSTAIVTALDTGKIWYFRVRAVNDSGSSGWSAISQVRIGTTPTAPTTWSYTSTVSIGKNATLNWVHNDEDGSAQTTAEIRLTINGTYSVRTVSGSTSVYNLSTDSYTDGTVIYWEVRTKGAMPSYSPWSTKRQIKIYAPASVSIELYQDRNWIWDTFEFPVDTIYSAKGDGLEPLVDGIVEHLPICVTAIAAPATQSVVSFSVSVIANEAYDTINEFGQSTHVQKGAEVYKHFFTDIEQNRLDFILSAGDINLESNMSYIIKVIAAMSSGLIGEGSEEFLIAWQSDVIEPSADIAIDYNSMSAYIRPFCDNGFADVLLSVYRREYDGTFTPIAVNIDASNETTVVDPHPSLDFARYRITALSKINGLVSFYDMPGQPIGGTSIIIQWDEEWTEFDIDDIGYMDAQPHSGSTLILPYNIDVQNSVSRDVSLVEYIGRESPVSYYGTQRGETASWSSEIPASDVDTLYQIRRLAAYPGDVYVREPSGIGYWANVVVSYSINHTETVIPVSFEITRVDGGM